MDTAAPPVADQQVQVRKGFVVNAVRGTVHYWKGGHVSLCAKYRSGTPEDPAKSAVFCMQETCPDFEPCPSSKIGYWP